MLKPVRTIFIILLFIMSCSFVYAAQEAGIIVSADGNAWVKRDSFKHALKLKTPVFKTDIISTDANARVQVLFNDDTVLTIGPNSELSIDEFLFGTEDKPQFAVKLIQGASRVITGKVVEQNPEGFKVGTPRTNVGIRGTDVYWVASDAADYVLVHQISKGKTVLATSSYGDSASMNKSGTLATFQMDKSVKIEKATREQIQNIIIKVQIGGSVQASTGSTVVVNEDLFNIGSVNNDNMTTSLERVQEDHNKVVIDDKFNREQNKPVDDQEQNKPVDDVLASYKGALSGAGLTRGSFGFTANLSKGSINNAYVLGTSSNGNFLGVNGSGKLTNSSSSGADYSLSNFTVSTNGIYDGLATITANGKLDHKTDRATIDGTFVSNNDTTGSFSGTGSYVDNLGGIPTLPQFYPRATYRGTTTSAGSSVGDFGFNVNLVASTISGAYFNVTQDDVQYMASGGTGILNLSRTTNSFTIDNFYVSSVSSDSRSNQWVGNITGGALDPNNLEILWNVKDKSGVVYADGTGNGAMVSGDTSSDIVVSYSGTDASGDMMGFKLNTSKGTVTDAYIYHDDIFGTVRATGGMGGSITHDNGTITIAASGFNKDATGMYTPIGVGGINANIFSDSTFSGSWVAAEVDSDGVNNGSYINGDINGSQGTASGGIPDMPTGDKIAHYKGDLNTYNSNYYFGYGSVGFDVNFAKTTDHVSNAYIYGEFTSGEKILASGGSGTLTMNTYFAEYDINNFTTIGTGTFDRPGYVSTMSGQISQSGTQNTNDWQIMNGVTNVANGTANIVQGIGPGTTPVIPGR